MRRRIKTLACVGAVAFTILLIYLAGALEHIAEAPFTASFDYPLNVNIRPLVDQIRYGIEPDIDPINYYGYKFADSLESKCPDDLRPRLVILVKSAMGNFDRRSVIRRTWGLERRFEDAAVRTVFLLGISGIIDEDLQRKIDQERKDHKDILQSGFVDSYYNNTIKTMMGFRWAVEFCPFSDFYLFSDDDMFISVKNLLQFVSDPHNYPEVKGQVWTRARRSTQQAHFASKSRQDKTVFTVDDKTEPLFAGFVFNSSPHRHRTSKWYVSLEEYAWDTWPAYVTAGAYVVSNEALKDMYAASLFTKHFKFDDIYLGILATKLGLKPFHCDEFYFYKKTYSPRTYKNLIASHGYGDPQELSRIWTAQLTGARV